MNNAVSAVVPSMNSLTLSESFQPLIIHMLIGHRGQESLLTTVRAKQMN